jgi:hypothetical protein
MSALIEYIKIAITIATVNVSCERSFSALKRIKNYLRNSMSDERLNGLSLMSIEKEISVSIDLNKIVNEFALYNKNRRIILM